MKNAAARPAIRTITQPPWQWRLEERSCIISLAETYNVLGWAPLNGGPARATFIVNHQIDLDDRAATRSPGAYLSAILRRLRLRPESAVAMMTGVDIRKTGYAAARRGDLIAGVWCTAGCSNALRIGDPASADPTRPGTINLAVALNQPLSAAAMAEALSMATEARVVAVREAGIVSTRSGQPATGTGTDCIVVASPARTPSHPYCGKHTVIGELIGKAAMRSCAKALRHRARR